MDLVPRPDCKACGGSGTIALRPDRPIGVTNMAPCAACYFADAKPPSDRLRATLDQIAAVLDNLSKRPKMYAVAPEALEAQAHVYMELRRTLLGAEPDKRPRPTPGGGIYETLHYERHGVNACPACSFLDIDGMAEFIAEWWRREQVAAPDRR